MANTDPHDSASSSEPDLFARRRPLEHIQSAREHARVLIAIHHKVTPICLCASDAVKPGEIQMDFTCKCLMTISGD